MMQRPLRENRCLEDRWFGVALIAALVAIVTPLEPVAGQQDGPGAMALREAAPAEWLTYGRDQAETHYSPLEQIDADNVGRLGLAWSWEIPKAGARLEATPLVSEGVMYATGPHSFVFALDARTGEKKWQWDQGIPDERQGGPSVCCGDVNRGVALYGNKVYAGLLDGRLVALNRETGLVEWVVQTTPLGQDYSITGAPRIANGNVIIGNGGAEYGVRGYVTAYDAETGDQAWRAYTVPGNPVEGFENEAMRAAAETWTGEWWVVGGGGSAWDTFAYDAEANLLYVGTGNGAPWNRDIRSPGGGDNLYLSSILALDADDGELVWHYQTTPGDDWDYTATQPLMLLDLTIDGRERKVIVQAPGILRDGHGLPVHAGTMEHGHDHPGRWRPSAGPAGVDRSQDAARVARSSDQHRGLARSVPGRGNGGTLSTGGNLVFWGSGTRLVAHNATTGEELWEAEVGGGTATPMTYELDGVQYVSIAAGSTSQGPRMWTFVLGGASEGVGRN